LEDALRTKLDGRLKRIAGQVAGIQRMVEEDRYCVDVLLQIAAVRAALDQAGKLLLGAHVDTCVRAAMESGTARARKAKVEELLEVFARFGSVATR
jgi:DNA-binding FrmR family transcriptional regulator